VTNAVPGNHIALEHNETLPDRSHMTVTDTGDTGYTRIWGGRTLGGAVTVSGSKNACLPLLAATLLTEETCTLNNVPQLTDTTCMIGLIRHLGVEARQLTPHTWSFRAKRITTRANKSLVERFRASIYLLGALLGRKHRASVAIPGGCKLGERPIDIHLRAFKALGATVTHDENGVHLKGKRPIGATFSMSGLRGPTVTGTANAILAAVLAEGKSVIRDAAQEPEIGDLCLFLKKMGAQIEGIGTNQIIIEGVPSLHGTDFTVSPDRIEAGTFLILGLLCCNTLRIIDAPKDVLCGFPEILSDRANHCHWDGCDLIVHRAQDLRPFGVATKAHPGFPTDLQSQIAVLASQIQGTSQIHDAIFPERFAYADAFRRLGMDIEKIGEGSVAITGKKQLKGTAIQATDLRAGAAMYLAGLIAEGETTVFRCDYIDRGYENFEMKLKALGATIERVLTQENPISTAIANQAIIFRSDLDDTEERAFELENDVKRCFPRI
jgi:UDP-N-acetylglucosamine 1-carboxyvinyltransferase